MVSAILLCVALCINAFYKSGPRLLVCLIVILSTGIHTHFFIDAVSFEYYGTAAIANLAVIMFISLFASSPLGTAIQVLSMTGIIINFIGYLMYEAFYPPDLYNYLMTVLIIAEFLRLIIRTRSDRIHDSIESGGLHNEFYFNGHFSNKINTSRHK